MVTLHFNDQRDADALRVVCRAEGIETSARYFGRGGVRLRVDAPRDFLPDLRAAADQRRAFFGNETPTTAANWRECFAFWVVGVWCDAQRADEANAAADLHDRDVYYLDAPDVWVSFVEFLGENDTRRAAWNAAPFSSL
jgi:hypothetical protein